jgi:hypothetical protein
MAWNFASSRPVRRRSLRHHALSFREKLVEKCSRPSDASQVNRAGIIFAVLRRHTCQLDPYAVMTGTGRHSLPHVTLSYEIAI